MVSKVGLWLRELAYCPCRMTEHCKSGLCLDVSPSVPFGPPHQGGRRLWHFFMLKLSTFSSVLFQMPRLHQIRSSQLSPGKYLMPFTRKGKRERTQYVAEKGVKKFFHFRAADESFE